MNKKLEFEQVERGDRASLHYAWTIKSYKSTMPLHFHPEVEIKYMIEGSGYRMTGDYLEPFKKGELILTPSNLPHCWIYDPDTCSLDKNRESIVVQFSLDILKQGLSFFPEWEYFANKLLLFQQSMKIEGVTSEKIIDELKRMQQLDSSERLLTLIRILEMIGTSDDVVPIGIPSIVPHNITKGMQRMQYVYRYLIENYKNKISLEEISQIANMSQNAFCAFFKKETGKTFNEFINEYRIEMACNILRNYRDMEVSEIAWKCGFTDIPYFNRYFKRKKGMSPSEWRN